MKLLNGKTEAYGVFPQGVCFIVAVLTRLRGTGRGGVYCNGRFFFFNGKDLIDVADYHVVYFVPRQVQWKERKGEGKGKSGYLLMAFWLMDNLR